MHAEETARHPNRVSFESFGEETDRRRGIGVNDRLLPTCAGLKALNIFFPPGPTTRENHPQGVYRQIQGKVARAFR
ncbi:MAG: hypothetical protein METHP_00210 [Methanoregula sp. SKADARSKE-2]|nr:MAG: hypothetical protein METHP_00210 [Methanoregula sp. SKADARSKE-2]